MLAVVAVAVHPLWSSSGMVSDDYPAVYLRIHQYFQEFQHGYLPALLPDVVQGGGVAFPTFYPPLAYYIGAGIYGLVGDIVWAGNLAALLSLLLSALTMVWAARWLGVPGGVAVVAGLAYATFPYRFTNVLVRGALAESWALVWLPLVLASAVRVARQERSGLVLAVTTGLLLLTHTALALWILPMVFAVVLVCSPGGHRTQIGITLASWFATGVALAAWYLVPARYYLPTVIASDPSVMFATASEFTLRRVGWRQALSLGELLIDPGTGVSLPVPMSVSLGLSPLVMPVALILTRRLRGGVGQLGLRGPRLELAAGLVAALALLMAAKPELIAGWLPQPWLYLQFPFRLMGLAGMFATIGIAVALGNLLPARTGWFVFAVWLLGVASTAVFSATRQIAPGQVTQHDLLPLLADQENGLTERHEYFPKLKEPEAVGSRVSAARDALRARAIEFRDTTNGLYAVLRLEQADRVILPRLAYDVLAVVDQTGRDLPLTSENGLVTVELPAGIHSLTVERRMPWPALLGIAISLLATLVLWFREARRTGGGPTSFRRHSQTLVRSYPSHDGD